jgi:hypothetical protein
MRVLRALASLLLIVPFMALVDLILFTAPIPGWIPVAMIVFQALYVVVVYGFMLATVALPASKS